MDKLELIRSWLESFPAWGDTQWGIDLTGYTPVSAGLVQEDDRIIGRKTDILGTSMLMMQAQFTFTRVSFREEATGAWIGEFSSWVRRQSEDCVCPCFGVDGTAFRLEKGKLESLRDRAVYTVRLTAIYDELYEVN